MEKGGQGNGTRFDRGGGNELDRVRKVAEATGFHLHLNRKERFCETCKQYKPRGSRKAVKGWKCADCREVIK